MRESVTYQEIVDEGRVEGRVEGEQQLLARLGAAKLGRPPAGAVGRLRAVTSRSELERLGVALLTANSWDRWLAAPAKPRRRRAPAR